MFRKIAANFGVRVGSALLNLVLAILFSQVLGPEGKGEQSLLLTTVAIIIIFDGLIGGASLVYLSSRLSWKRLIIAAYVWCVLVSGLTFLALLSVFHFSAQSALNIVILSALSSFTSVNASLLLGKEKLKAYNAIQLIVPILTLLVVLIQYYILQSIFYEWALFTAYMSSLLLSILLLDLHWSKQEDASKWSIIWQQLFQFGFMNQLAHVLQLLSFRLTFYLLAAQGAHAGVGLMSNASSITESIWLVASSISLWQYAVISNSSDVQYNQQITEKLARFGMLVSLLVLIVFLLLPTEFYSFVFGKSFGGIRILMYTLAPGVWVFTYALIVGHYFSGIGKYSVNALASGVGLVVCYFSSLFLIPHYTETGAGLAMSVSYITTSIVVAYFFFKAGGKLSIFPNFTEIKVLFARLFRVVIKDTNV
jgi:O-antigen/teichoic acid export membrane protein